MTLDHLIEDFSFFNSKPSENHSCNVLVTGNKTFVIQRDWEGIPEATVLNLVVCGIFILIFVFLHKKAWSKESRSLSHTQKGWLQFIYGDRESDTKKTQNVSLRSNRHSHDLLHPQVILPPTLVDFPSENPSLSEEINVMTDESDAEEEIDAQINNLNQIVTQDDQQDLIGVCQVSTNTFNCRAHSDKERSKRKSEYHAHVSTLQRINSSESITHYGFWFFEFLSIKDNDILQSKGSDALQYLIFQRYIIYFLLFITFICLAIVLPINIHGDYEGNAKPFGKTTMNNLAITSEFLWVHPILSALFLIIGIYMMNHFSREIKADEEQVAQRTLYIQRIKSSHRSKEQLSEYFSKNFPGILIEGIQFVYNIRKIQDLELEYRNNVTAKLYCRDYLDQYNERCEVRPYFLGQFGGICGCCLCCPKVDGLNHYSEKEKEIENEIKDQLAHIISHPAGSVFITFKTEKMAMDVYKVLKERQRIWMFSCCTYLMPGVRWIKKKLFNQQSEEIDCRDWIINYAPSPDDINWKELAVDTRLLWLKKIIVYILLFAIFFFLSTPTILLQYFSVIKLTQALEDGLSFFNSTLTEFLSPLLLMLMTVVLPAIVTYFSELLPYKTISSLNHGIMWKVFFFLLMMVLILPSAGFISLTAFLENILSKNETSFRLECLFPVDSGAFFVNYVIQAAFIGNTMELMRFPELILYLIYVIIARSPAEYENARQQILFDFSFGVRYPRFLLIFAMVVTYSVAVPLITPCGLVYMVLKHLVDRYNIYYVYQPSKISGRIHSTAVLYIHISLLMLQFQILAFLFLKTGHSDKTGFSLIVFIISLLIFAGHCFLHSFCNINHLTYNATTRLTKKIKKQEHCACAYFPTVFSDLLNEKIVRTDYFVTKTKVLKTESLTSSSTSKI